jgi:RHS repeat-associated protein
LARLPKSAISDWRGELVFRVWSATGEPTSWGGARFRYTGQATLPEVSLYYYKARMYGPHLGRFLQTDPVGYTADYNLYAYVGNDYVNRGDPTGLAFCNVADDSGCGGNSFGLFTSTSHRDPSNPENIIGGLAEGAAPCISDPLACTFVDPGSLRGRTTYGPSYYRLNPIAQGGVRVHEEGVHQGQINRYVGSNLDRLRGQMTVWDRTLDYFTHDYIPGKVGEWVDQNRAALEAEAYRQEIEYLRAHINDYGGKYYKSTGAFLDEREGLLYRYEHHLLP